VSFATTTLNSFLDKLDTLATHASIHTADPGGTGASEVAGGSYARQAITWAAASSASKTLTGTVTFQIPSGTTITHAGTWSASSGGTWRGGAALDSSQSFPTGGTYTLNLTATAS
jgi:hypothetical protein